MVVVAACALVAAAPKAETVPIPPVNQRVVGYAREQVGKRVGDGSCITLAMAALAHAGARRYPLDDPAGDYVWGTVVRNPKDALPGDILQFRDAVFKGRKTLPGRRWISWSYTYPHHTAVVDRVSEGGKLFSILHQNVGAQGADDKEKKVVQEGTLRMDSLQPGGWVRIYRPVAVERRRIP
jgi:hypothetical protein